MQVIVRYAAIELTPEHPEFAGGAWHVEGMRAESIVASAVAYLRCENITTSFLEFRSMVKRPGPHIRGDLPSCPACVTVLTDYWWCYCC